MDKTLELVKNIVYEKFVGGIEDYHFDLDFLIESLEKVLKTRILCKLEHVSPSLKKYKLIDKNSNKTILILEFEKIFEPLYGTVWVLVKCEVT